MFLPASGLFQVLNRCTFPATEQVETRLLFGLFAACRLARSLLATNDVSMNASFVAEVQSNERSSGAMPGRLNQACAARHLHEHTRNG